MTTYEQDLTKAQLALKRWLRKAALAKTKLRRIKARIKRLNKHIGAGHSKRARRPPPRTFPNLLPVIPEI